MPTPDGKVLNQKISEELATESQLVFINGHYKGIDQRIRDNLVTDEISIGDYILTGGELASMVILDSIVGLIPGVLNSKESADTDSFSYPLYVDILHSPRGVRGMKLKDFIIWTSSESKRMDDEKA